MSGNGGGEAGVVMATATMTVVTCFNFDQVLTTDNAGETCYGSVLYIVRC